MSTVDQRPALPSEVVTYGNCQYQRLLVKPGMTCYWQTCRNCDPITFDEWVDLDLCGDGRIGVFGTANLIAGQPFGRACITVELVMRFDMANSESG